jgi:hypothetical protein
MRIAGFDANYAIMRSTRRAESHGAKTKPVQNGWRRTKVRGPAGVLLYWPREADADNVDIICRVRATRAIID